MAQRVLIVGCGAVTERMYVKALPKVPGVTVASVCDLDDASAQRIARQLGTTASTFEEALPDVDVVIVATPPSSHFALVRQALEAGKTVLCEKPFVGTGREARELVAIGKARGVPLYVGHFRRCFPSVRAARDLIRSGALGRVVAIDIIEGGRFSWATRSGYVEKDPFGGVLFDTGSHAVDMALHAAVLDAEELSVEVRSVRRDRPEPAHEVEASFRLRASNTEVQGSLLLSRYRALANRVRITLEAGTVDISTAPRDRIRVWGPAGTTLLYAAERGPDYQTTFLAQLCRVFGVVDGADDFLGDRFTSLTAILEAVAAHDGGTA